MPDLSKACEQLMEKFPCDEIEEASVEHDNYVDVEELVHDVLEDKEAGVECEVEKEADSGEGFDDEEIEEVRIYQTQNIKYAEEKANGEDVKEQDEAIPTDTELVEDDDHVVNSGDETSNLSGKDSDSDEDHEVKNRFEKSDKFAEEIDDILDNTSPYFEPEISKVKVGLTESSSRTLLDKLNTPVYEEEKAESSDSDMNFEAPHASEQFHRNRCSDDDFQEEPHVSEDEDTQENAFILMGNESIFDSCANDNISEKDEEVHRCSTNQDVKFVSQEMNTSIDLFSDEECDVQVWFCFLCVHVYGSRTVSNPSID